MDMARQESCDAANCPGKVVAASLYDAQVVIGLKIAMHRLNTGRTGEHVLQTDQM